MFVTSTFTWLSFQFLLYPHESFLYLIDKENAPKSISDVKLINAGKILENNKTLADSRLPIGELPGAIITMHVVVRPPVSDENSGNSKTYFLYIFVLENEWAHFECINRYGCTFCHGLMTIEVK